MTTNEKIYSNPFFQNPALVCQNCLYCESVYESITDTTKIKCSLYNNVGQMFLEIDDEACEHFKVLEK